MRYAKKNLIKIIITVLYYILHKTHNIKGIKKISQQLHRCILVQWYLKNAIKE